MRGKKRKKVKELRVVDERPKESFAKGEHTHEKEKQQERGKKKNLLFS